MKNKTILKMCGYILLMTNLTIVFKLPVQGLVLSAIGFVILHAAYKKEI